MPTRDNILFLCPCLVIDDADAVGIAGANAFCLQVDLAQRAERSRLECWHGGATGYGEDLIKIANLDRNCWLARRLDQPGLIPLQILDDAVELALDRLKLGDLGLGFHQCGIASIEVAAQALDLNVAVPE